MNTKLQDALEALYGLERRRDKLGLEGTRRLLCALGDPQRRFRAVHVAGTNGKGSVCALVERVLRAAGHRTGLFTSPHLVDFRERIRVCGRWADERGLARRLEHIGSLPEGRDRTFFEVATALGFDDFAARGVEWAVVEVGLGGRLDTTNVLEPALTVITPIALDHTETLGDTIEAIAREKAGILKPGVPVVDGAGPLEAIRTAAAECGAPLIPARSPARGAAGGAGAAPGRRAPRGRAAPAWSTRLAVDVPPWGGLDLECPLLGAHQAHNLDIALAALAALAAAGVTIPAAAVREGVRAVRWPGRLEPCPSEPRLWWDGAHNAAGVAHLARAWVASHGAPPASLVLALSQDKDAAAIARVVAEAFAGTRVIATRSRNPRAMEPSVLARAAAACGLPAVTAPDVAAALRTGLDGAGLVLLAGSLFAVGEAMQAYGGAPGECT